MNNIFHDAEMISNCLILSAFGLKSLFIIKNSSLVFYRPLSSPAQTLSSIEDSIGLAFDSKINDVFITGDLNLDTLKNTSSQKISAICQQFSVTQMIVEPTHFTEHSSSIIDLIFASNKNSILFSGVGEPFLDQNVRYHCPVYFVLNL